MKKNIFLFSVFMILVACSTKKDAFINRTYQNFTSYYNTLFHGKEALKSELNNKKKEHKDNFYDGYIEVFTQNSLATDTLSNIRPQFFGGDFTATPHQSANLFQKAEEKALKIIEKKSMVFKGVEKNKEVFNAYILLAEARIYQGRLFEALDALNQLYSTMSKDKRIPLAKIYEGLIYSKLKEYSRAEDIFLALDKDANLKKEYRKLLSVYYAENLLYSNRKQEAIEQLDLAMNFNKSREVRSRIAFLKGHILSDLGQKEEARNSFAQAYKYANNFEFEVKAQVEIAKTFNTGDDYEGAKQYLEKISKKGIYTSRKNEFYYALGLMANKAGQKEEAQEFFRKSVKEKALDNTIRGLAYYEIGQSHFEKEDYIRSGAYYDSALAVIEYEPIKGKIKDLSSNIKNISKNYYLVKKNDSILALTKMSEPQRVEFFQKHIEELKQKEEKQRAIAAQKAKENRRVETVDFTTDMPSFANSFSSIKSNKFYFSNRETIAKGSLEFKRIWGNRGLGDNWRVSKNNSISLSEVENKTLGRENVADARRFEVAYYTEKIPTDKEAIAQLKKERDTASLGLGRMYESYFQNTPLATKTLYELVEQNPEEEVKLQALYLIFSINFEKNPNKAELAKNLILKEFLYTPYAEFVKNPRRRNLEKTNEETKKVYQTAYTLFSEEKFEEAKSIIAKAVEQYPKDALVPKFELLNAFITGKTAGKEVMALQLQQIVFNYEKTKEGAKAKEILKFLNKEEKEEEKNNTKNETSSIIEEVKAEEPVIEETPVKAQPKQPKKVDKKANSGRLERPTYTWDEGILKPEN